MTHASSARQCGIAPPPPPLVFSPQADRAAPAIDASARRRPHYRKASPFPISPALICSYYPTINGPQASVLSQCGGLGAALRRLTDGAKPLGGAGVTTHPSRTPAGNASQADSAVTGHSSSTLGQDGSQFKMTREAARRVGLSP